MKFPFRKSKKSVDSRDTTATDITAPDTPAPEKSAPRKAFRLPRLGALLGKLGLKRLDRYIISNFLGTYLFAIVLILAITIMFDINEKLDSFLKAPLRATLFDYFLNFLPYFANQFSPLFTFIAVIFFTSKLADKSEIIAMLSTGMSFRRLLLPYMVSAAVIAFATYILSAYVIPPANVKRIEYTNTYVKNKKVEYGSNIQLQVSKGEIAYMSRYDNKLKTGYKFSLETFKDKKLVSRLTANTVKWDTLDRWQVRDYMIRDLSGKQEIITRGTRLDTVIPIQPRDFLISKNDHETLTTPQLSEYIDSQKERGVANIKTFEIEYHRRFAMTAAAFILTIIGMSLSSRKVKGGMGLNIGVGLVLSFGYILFTTVTSTFAVSGLTSPMVAMWIPNIVYGIIAVILYRKAAQ
ncbi:MAG: LptF/LptG family permease [Paramuribaculum sp.]|nr:LptF/LptG family permease [Paramuribaculum sp.]